MYTSGTLTQHFTSLKETKKKTKRETNENRSTDATFSNINGAINKQRKQLGVSFLWSDVEAGQRQCDSNHTVLARRSRQPSSERFSACWGAAKEPAKREFIRRASSRNRHIRITREEVEYANLAPKEKKTATFEISKANASRCCVPFITVIDGTIREMPFHEKWASRVRFLVERFFLLFSPTIYSRRKANKSVPEAKPRS